MGLVRRIHATILIAICLFSFATRTAAQPATPVVVPQLPPSEAFEGKPVSAITFDPAVQPLEAEVVNSLLPIRAGQPFHATDARAAIEKLFATGRYEDIQIDAQPSGTGVALRFITKNSWFFGHIAIRGDIAEPPNTGQILSVAGLTLGAPYDPAMVTAAEDKLRQLLISNGYFVPIITHHLDYENTFQQVLVTFEIKVGHRARYTLPTITGDTSVLNAKTIARATAWHRFLIPGYRGITQTRTRVGIDNIRLRYQKSNHLLATVTFSGIEPVDAEKRFPKGAARINVNPGPAVIVTAAGATCPHWWSKLPGHQACVTQGDLTNLLPIYEEGTVDTDLLTEGVTTLRNYFQERGYFDVAVDFRQQQEHDRKTDIEYSIQLGPRHRLVALVIRGNEFFDEKSIRERMFLIPKSLEYRRGRYSEAFAARDKAVIEDLYRSNGFRDVHVNTETQDDYRNVKGDIASFFTIHEGAQYKVASLTITGAEKVDLAETKEQLSSQDGQAFSEYSVALDRDAILTKYGAAGYTGAMFSWTWDPGSEPNTADLHFVIQEGQPQFVRQVAITGLSTTRRWLAVAQVQQKPGDPLSASAMIETQRRLYDLGIFSAVNMAIQNPDGDEERRLVQYDLLEASRYSITIGAGTEFGRIGGGTAAADLSNPGGSATLVPHLSLGLTRLNLFGLGRSIGLQVRLSTVEKRAGINYFVPRVFNRTNLEGTFSVLYDDTFDVTTFRSIRREFSAQIAQRFRKTLTAFYRFSYRDVGISDLKISPLLVPRLTQSVRVGITSLNLVHDRRDDSTDPHKGIYSTLDVGLASKVFGSETTFLRILGRNATYHRIGQHFVLARETQFGIEPAFHIPASADPSDPIPLPERFYGGGGNTMRGFPQNQAGPRDTATGFPLGGSALFFNNTELRFPLYGANVHGVLFEDMGNVYSTISKMSFRVSQRSISDFDYMAHAVGFGIRYRTPIGPMRLDLAYGLNPTKYNGFAGSYSQLVQCSATGTCQPSTQQIGHIQFFFSIGQAF